MPWISAESGSQNRYPWGGPGDEHVGDWGTRMIMPTAGAIIRVEAGIAGGNGPARVVFAIWDSNRNFLERSPEFTVAEGSLSIGGQYWYTMDLLNPVKLPAGATFYAGASRRSTDRLVWSGRGGYEGGNTYVALAGDSPFPTPATLSRPEYTIWGTGLRLHVDVFYIIAPRNPTSVSATRVSDSRIEISWDHSADSDRPLDYFEVQRQTNGGSWTALTTTTAKKAIHSTQAGNSYRYRVRAVNGAGESSWVYTSTVVTSPLPPTNASVSRISDTSHSITWTNDSNAGNTYKTVRVQRWDNVGGIWATVATLSGSSQSYTDTGTRSDREYQWRVRAENAAGSSDYAITNRIKTTPAAPSNANLTQEGEAMRITWQNNATTADRIRIEHSINGGDWVTIESSLDPSTNSYLHPVGAGNHTFRIRAEVTNPDLNSNYAITNEVRFTLEPEAPTNAQVSRESDNQQNIVWTNNDTEERPYDDIQIRRWDNITGSYYTIATISGSNSSYSDTTTQANRKYRYSIRAINTAGSSDYDYTDYINTTPAAPVEVVASRQGLDVSLSWSNPATNAERVRIERQTDGGSYTHVITLGGAATSYTDIEPGGGIHRYRVRTETDNPTLSSVWVESNEVLTLMQPNPPSGLSPHGIAFDANENREFTWQFNTVDGTSQTQYEIRYRETGGSWQYVGPITSIETRHNFPAGTFQNGKQYEWQVRAWGQHADASEYSSTATFFASSRPTVTVTYPTDDVAHPFPDLTVSWIYNDAEGDVQDRYRITLFSGEVQIYNVTQAGTATEHEIDQTLSDGETYTVRVEVRNDKGLWSSANEVTFTVEYEAPPVPELETTFNVETGAITLQIRNPDPVGPQPDTAYNRVYRQVNGEWELIARNIPKNGSFTDFVPKVGTCTRYYVEAISDLPSVNTSYVNETPTNAKGYFYLNSGSNWSDCIRLQYDPSITETFGRQTVIRRYHGRKYPVQYQGEALENSINFSVSVDISDIPQLRKVIEENYGPIYYRDYTGRRFKAAITRPRLSKVAPDLYQFSGTFERVEE